MCKRTTDYICVTLNSNVSVKNVIVNLIHASSLNTEGVFMYLIRYFIINICFEIRSTPTLSLMPLCRV